MECRKEGAKAGGETGPAGYLGRYAPYAARPGAAEGASATETNRRSNLSLLAPSLLHSMQEGIDGG